MNIILGAFIAGIFLGMGIVLMCLIYQDYRIINNAKQRRVKLWPKPITEGNVKTCSKKYVDNGIKPIKSPPSPYSKNNKNKAI